MLFSGSSDASLNYSTIFSAIRTYASSALSSHASTMSAKLTLNGDFESFFARHAASFLPMKATSLGCW